MAKGQFMKAVVDNYDAKDILKMIREWTEMTQKDFADSVYLSEITIQGYEQGVRRCSIDTFLEIAKRHGVKITIEKDDWPI